MSRCGTLVVSLVAMCGAVAPAAPSPSPVATRTPLGCAVPDADARTLVPGAVDAVIGSPSGVVQVRVSLDRESRITSTSIYRSPSQVLNGPALDAARATTFATKVESCHPREGDYVLNVGFNGTASPQMLRGSWTCDDRSTHEFTLGERIVSERRNGTPYAMFVQAEGNAYWSASGAYGDLTGSLDGSWVFSDAGTRRVQYRVGGTSGIPSLHVVDSNGSDKRTDLRCTR